MNRQIFPQYGATISWEAPLIAAVQNRDKLDVAGEVLARDVAEGQLVARSLGVARSPDDRFLIGSISKTMTVVALMTLHDRDGFRLDDPVRKVIPEFTGPPRNRITIRQLRDGVPQIHERIVFRPLDMNHSALGLGRFSLEEVLPRRGRILRLGTAGLMVRNHNPGRLPPRGLGFA